MADTALTDLYDVIVIGTGLAESIVAAAAARAGHSVLHLDAADYYGGDGASLPLPQFLETAKRCGSVAESRHVAERSAFPEIAARLCTSGARLVPLHASHCNLDISHCGDVPASLAKIARKFCIDLQPSLVLARGGLVDLVVESGASNYLEFKSLEAAFMMRPSSGSEDAATLIKIPASKGDVFSHSELSLVDKRRLMKFLQFALDLYHSEHGDVEDLAFLNETTLGSGRTLLRPQNKTQLDFSFDVYRQSPFRAFLEHCELSSRLQDMMLNAVALVADFQPPVSSTSTNSCSAAPSRGSSVTTTIDAATGMRLLCRHLAAIGRFGSTAFLVPMYGSSELSQAFCRLCAVKGGIYMLRTEGVAAVVGPATLSSLLLSSSVVASVTSNSSMDGSGSSSGDGGCVSVLDAASVALSSESDDVSASPPLAVGIALGEQQLAAASGAAANAAPLTLPGTQLHESATTTTLPSTSTIDSVTDTLSVPSFVVMVEPGATSAPSTGSANAAAASVSASADANASASAPSSDNHCLGIVTSDGNFLRCRAVLSSSGVGLVTPDSPIVGTNQSSASAPPDVVLGTAVFITTEPLQSILARVNASGSRSSGLSISQYSPFSRSLDTAPAGLVTVVVPATAASPGSSNDAAVFVVQQCSSSSVCPDGYFVVHLMTHVRRDGSTSNSDAAANTSAKTAAAAAAAAVGSTKTTSHAAAAEAAAVDNSEEGRMRERVTHRLDSAARLFFGAGYRTLGPPTTTASSALTSLSPGGADAPYTSTSLSPSGADAPYTSTSISDASPQHSGDSLGPTPNTVGTRTESSAVESSRDTRFNESAGAPPDPAILWCAFFSRAVFAPSRRELAPFDGSDDVPVVGVATSAAAATAAVSISVAPKTDTTHSSNFPPSNWVTLSPLSEQRGGVVLYHDEIAAVARKAFDRLYPGEAYFPAAAPAATAPPAAPGAAAEVEQKPGTSASIVDTADGATQTGESRASGAQTTASTLQTSETAAVDGGARTAAPDSLLDLPLSALAADSSSTAAAAAAASVLAEDDAAFDVASALSMLQDADF